MSSGPGPLWHALLGALLLAGIVSITLGSLLMLRPELFKGRAAEGKRVVESSPTRPSTSAAGDLHEAFRELKDALKKVEDMLSNCGEAASDKHSSSEANEITGNPAVTSSPTRPSTLAPGTSVETTSAKQTSTATETTPVTSSSRLAISASSTDISAKPTFAKDLTTNAETNIRKPSNTSSVSSPNQKILLIAPLVLVVLVAAIIFLFRNKCIRVYKDTVLPENGMENRVYGKNGDIVLLGVTPCGPEGRDNFCCYIPDETAACKELPSYSTD